MTTDETTPAGTEEPPVEQAESVETADPLDAIRARYVEAQAAGDMRAMDAATTEWRALNLAAARHEPPAPVEDAELLERAAAGDVVAMDKLNYAKRAAMMPAREPFRDPQGSIQEQMLAAQEKGDWREVDRLNAIKRAAMLAGR